MSKYWVNKFLFTVDRDPEYLKRYAEGKRLINIVDKRVGFPRPEDRFCV